MICQGVVKASLCSFHYSTYFCKNQVFWGKKTACSARIRQIVTRNTFSSRKKRGESGTMVTLPPFFRSQDGDTGRYSQTVSQSHASRAVSSDPSPLNGRSSPISSNGGNGRSIRLYYSTSRRRCQLFLVIFGIIYRGNFSRFFDRAIAHPAEIRSAAADTVEPQPFLAGGVSDSGALPCSAVSAGAAG